MSHEASLGSWPVRRTRFAVQWRTNAIATTLLWTSWLATQQAAAKDPPKGVFDAPPALSTSLGDDIVIAPEHLETEPNSHRKPHGEFAGTPLPVVNPTIGNGLGAVGMYAQSLRATDKQSPPSIFGGGLFLTDNGSRGAGLGTKLFFNEDRFRLTAGVGRAKLNYDFYGVGNETGEKDISIPISQSATAFVTEGQVKVVERWFAGVRFQTVKTTVGLEFELPESDIEIPSIELDSRVAAIGLHIQRDARDSIFYPRAGSNLDVMTNFYSGALGSDFDHDAYLISYANYGALGDRVVLAYRVTACGISGRAPFFGLCRLGSDKDLRGYEAGRYRDRRLLAGQIEYRRSLPNRLGFTVFTGAGAVAPRFQDFHFSSVRPSIGAGVRYTLAERSGVNLRFDVAVGSDGLVWYVSMGEAF